MICQKPASRRRFTDAARAAAADARRRKREAAVPRETPEVYVVRLPGAHLQFGWEIRRFGAIVLDRGETRHSTTQGAWTAGKVVLDGPRAPNQSDGSPSDWCESVHRS